MNYFNYPVKKEYSDYNNAIENYINNVSKYGEDVSIYRCGNIGVPGISDIDFLVFMENNCSANYSIYSNIPEQLLDLLMHDVYIIPKIFAKDLHLITSVFELKHLYGDKINFNKYNDEYELIRKIIFLNDIALVSFSHEFKKKLENPQKDVRLIIARINSLKYPIKIIGDIFSKLNINSKSLNMYNIFVEEFSDYRSDFFLRDRKLINNEILNYLELAKDIGSSLLNDIKIINRKVNYFNCMLDNISFNCNGKKLSSNKLDKSFFSNLYGYANFSNGPISNVIKNNFSYTGFVDFNSDYKYLLDKRINLLNEITLFRKRKKIYYGALWPFGYRMKRNYYKRIRKFISKKLK